MTDIQDRLRKLELRGGKKLITVDSTKSIYKLSNKDIDQIIALFEEEGWLSPEERAKAVLLLEQLKELRNDWPPRTS